MSDQTRTAIKVWWWRLLHALPPRMSVWLRTRIYRGQPCSECGVAAWLNPKWDHEAWVGHPWQNGS